MKIINSVVDLDAFFRKVQGFSLLMLDYDGTLAPFVKERMEAYPYPGVADRLHILESLKKTDW